MDAALRTLDRRFAGRSPFAALALPLAAALLALGPCLLAVLGAGRAILGPSFAPPLLTLAWQVFLLLWFVGALAYTLDRLQSRLKLVERAPDAGARAGEGECDAGGSPEPDPIGVFRTRWPAGLAGRLLALEMEDHYMRVHTDAGSDLILCRMRDAARDLAAADGMQVHRSYWVARTAVSRVERRNERPVLVLENGLVAPVGRTYIARVRAAGWLDGGRPTETGSGSRTSARGR